MGILIKGHCAGAPFDALGRSPGSAAPASRICYSDIQHLWVGRNINLHVFPYIHGWIDSEGHLQGGSIEYPVLSGLLFWLGAIGAHNDQQYLFHMALLLTPFGLVTGWVLGKLSGWTALLWAFAPPLAMYAFHNMELPVVAAATVAIAVMEWTRRRGVPPRYPGFVTAAVLGIGFDLKFYPAIFVAPLALYVLTYGAHRRPDDAPRYDWRGALGVAGVATVVAILANLPFVAAGYDGWRAAWTFQEMRNADGSSNSIWFWGVRHLFPSPLDHDVLPHDSDLLPQDYNAFVGQASPALIGLAFVALLAVGWRRYTRTGQYPWIGVSAAMLSAFLLLHKVHSPQYTLWLLPFFILLRVDWRLVVAYLVCDLSLELTIWDYFHQYGEHSVRWWVQCGVLIGVWGRAAILALFLGYLPAAQVRERNSSSSLADAAPFGGHGAVRQGAGRQLLTLTRATPAPAVNLPNSPA